MTDRADVFLDTNIFIYAAQGRSAAPEKYQIALRIIIEEDYGSSAQVLSEFFVNVIKKGTRPLAREKATEWVRLISRKPCQPIDARLVSTAIDLSQRYRISYWDAAILAAAERLSAKTLYSEDLNHGQVYGSVRVINPFISP